MSCRKATDSYLWRNPERVCVKERTHLVKYRSNIWHNLFNNEACHKALNFCNRKCNLAPTKRKTVRMKHIEKTKMAFSSRCLGFKAKVVCKDIMNGHFKRLFLEITSVCRTILRFFLIFSRCNKETLIYRTDLCPGIHFRLKVIPSWMEKRSFFIQILQPHINQNGSA